MVFSKKFLFLLPYVMISLKERALSRNGTGAASCSEMEIEMNIVFYRYGNICEPDILSAFQRFGIEVAEETTEVYQKVIEPALRIRLISELILTKQPLFVFSINFFPYIAKICEKLKVLYVCLSVDCPVLELFSEAIRSPYNRIFLFDRHQYQQFYGENKEHIYYLPLSANTEHFDEVLKAPLPESIPAQMDVSFVGSLYNEKSRFPSLSLSDHDRGFFDGLIEAQLKLPGLSLLEEAVSPALAALLKKADPAFPSLPDEVTDTARFTAVNYLLSMQTSSLERIRTLNAIAGDFDVHLFTRSDASVLKGVHCHGGVGTLSEMPHVFHNSKINLNMTIRSIQTGLSQRIFDVLGCGGFLLTNYQAEIPEYFKPGCELDCYEDTAELKEKLSYYLQHDERRMEIAQNGYQTVNEQHSLLLRISALLKIVLTEQAPPR